MAVPCGDQRDWDFATHFGLDIINIFENIDVNEKSKSRKRCDYCKLRFFERIKIKKAIINVAINKIEEEGIGRG